VVNGANLKVGSQNRALLKATDRKRKKRGDGKRREEKSRITNGHVTSLPSIIPMEKTTGKGGNLLRWVPPGIIKDRKGRRSYLQVSK